MTRAESFYRSAHYGVGDSPYQVKGVAYIYHFEWVEAFLPGGEAAQREALGALGDDPFWSTSWKAGVTYDVLPLIALGHACAEVMGMDAMAFAQMRAEHQADRDMTSARRFLMSIMSPKMMAKRLPFFASQFFTFGKPGAEALPNGARMWLRGVPEIVEPWIAATCTGFMSHSLRATGAREISIRPFKENRNVATRERPVVDVGLEITWAEAS